MEITAAYLEARRYVERKIGFYVHSVAFLVVNSGLILLDLQTTPDRTWAFWPLTGWGIGLLFHGLAVFLRAPGAGWKQRMIENELKKTST